MALDFPSSPALNQTYSYSGRTWKWNGEGWALVTDGTVTTSMLADDAITYAKLQNVTATDRLLGRSSAGAGNVEEITCTAAGRALLDDADAAAQRTTLGLGTLATQSGTFSGTSSGTNTGDQTITLTGDVTGSGTGSFAATLANTTVSAGSYTFANLTVDAKGRLTAASSGTPVTSFSAGTTGLTPSTSTTGAVTLAGTLAVANGGTGVTTSTGSGSVVLSTSPTLVTPLLGTPTSGTLTNCTGYTFANIASKPTTLSGYGITDAASSTHTHGNISNAGAIGTTANLPIITTTGGVLTTGSFGTAANTFCQGNDSRLSDTRLTTNSVTFNGGGAGAASGSTFNGGSALTVSYNTVGAPATDGTSATGTWSIGVTGNAGTATTLQTARNIQGVSFNGSADITVVTAGTGISVTGTAVANTGVLSVNGSTGAITNVALTNAVQSFTVAQRGSVTALTDAATITSDFATANNFSVTLGGNRTLGNPSNLVAGQSGIIVITQDGTGNKTLAYASNWKFAGGTAPVLSTAANAVDILAYYVESGTRISAALLKAMA